MNITKPKDVGSIWPLHRKDKLMLITIIVAINDWLSEIEPGRKIYEGWITVDVPVDYDLIQSMHLINDTFVIKARDAQWKAAKLELVRNDPPIAELRFLLGR